MAKAMGSFKFPEERSSGQGTYFLRVQSEGNEHIFFSPDGNFSGQAAPLVALLKEIYPKPSGTGTLEKLAWRKAPKP